MGGAIDFNNVFFGRHEGRHKIVTAIVLLLVISLVIFYQYQITRPAEVPPVESPVATVKETVTTGGQAAAFCNEFKGVDYKVSCGEAVSRALANSPGIVQNVSIGTINVPRISSDPGSGLIKRNAWLVDIKLENPHFNEILNKEMEFERIFIGLDKDFGIYKKPLG